MENKHFISMLLQTIPDQHDTQIIHLIRRIKMTMLNWYKECLTEAYGTKVKPYIWDFSIMFQGVVREYTSLSLKENKDIDFHRVAYFVVEAFERMIDHSTGLTPVLTSREMADYEHFGLGMEPAPPVEQFRELLTELQNKIRQSQVAAQTREELLAAVACLQQEVQAPHPRGFLIQSLLLYLKKIQTYEPVVRRIEVVLQAVFTEEK
ncbi:hypothetical protein RWE15_04910 [Virgibacillus halophilus]|uniref:Uncharacterized protein n=1 Tax=Tigheibacillus halophilus TaxID=361280 RepID=A0ABU5C5V3_9BACI|nr:hypothetical protein [Virgibacillus halophilus]